jgi:dCMP deaminase
MPRSVKPRSGVPSWEEYFMSVALLSARRSKDPACQVGACIVNSDNRIIGIGYNGFPVGCFDLPWEPRSSERRVGFLGTKHAYVCHAELNAVVNALSITELKGSSIYVTMFPCNECAKLIIQVGITNVFYLRDSKHGSDSATAARRMFDMVGIKYRQLATRGRRIVLQLR